jgi:hypothetical protein
MPSLHQKNTKTIGLHHKLPISQKFNKIRVKIIKQYFLAKSMGFKM